MLIPKMIFPKYFRGAQRQTRTNKGREAAFVRDDPSRSDRDQRALNSISIEVKLKMGFFYFELTFSLTFTFRCSSPEYTPTGIYPGIIWARTEYT